MVNTSTNTFTSSTRLLLGPGPSMVHPRVLNAMAKPLIGHLDPEFLDLMNGVQDMLRRLFRTKNPFTLAVSGTGSAGMEALLVNLVQPGDHVIVGVNGVFGSRMKTIIERCGGQPQAIDAPWGQIIEPDAVRTVFSRMKGIKAVALVHAETSTGAWQPLEEIGTICREHDALFIVDAVTSLAGLPVEVDSWNIDACYSGTQKCLSCPPGLSPITLNSRALSAIHTRTHPCPSWYLDLSLVADYWTDQKRTYHHTAPISMFYALHEALRVVEEEGLAPRWARHHKNSKALMAGLEALGLRPFAQSGHRLSSLNCVTLPGHVDDSFVRQTLLQDWKTEIGGGLGSLKGKVWRIGLMGESSVQANVYALLGALEEIFFRKKWIDKQGAALTAATQVYGARRTTQ